MQLDVPTLMLAGAFVAMASGVLLAIAWYQFRETHAALWWAAAYITLSLAIVLMVVAAATTQHALFVAGTILLGLSSLLTWAGARSFDGHRIGTLVLLAGPVVWLSTSAAYAATGAVWPAAMLHAIVTVFYYGAAALSFRSGRGEALQARLVLFVVISLHAAVLMVAIPVALVQVSSPDAPPSAMSFSGIIHFEVLVFVIGSAIYLVAMMKERAEQRNSDASMTDALTGLLNRRGFLRQASRVLRRAARDETPVAVIVFDLDHFKLINDGFGHDTGDRVLRTFADVCREVLRPGDVIGRMGGEEFAAVLPGFDVEAAAAMAERVRKAFAQAALAVDAEHIGATLSGGVASSPAASDIHALLKRADLGLYLAKDNGRNRIEFILSRPGIDGPPNIIRIA